MKLLAVVLSGIALGCATSLAGCGYRDLKREMDAYAPPVMMQQAQVSVLPVYSADAFEAEKATIERLRANWEKVVSETAAVLGGADVQPGTIEAATDESLALNLLRPPFALQTVQSLILLRNPSIKAATHRLRATLEGFDQVTQLDDILRQYSAFTESVMAGVGPMRGADNIRMIFPFPGVTALKGQVAEKNVEAEKQTLDLIRRDIVAQGSKAYWNLFYIHRAQQITRNTLDRLNQLESVATTRYSAGKTSYQDVIKIRIGREKLQEQLATLKEQRINLESELLSLMDLRPENSLGRPDTPIPPLSIPPLDLLYALALDNRQELNRMRAMVGKMERMVEMAETMIQPAFSQNYSLFTDKTVLQVGSAAMEPTFSNSISPTRGKGLPKNAWYGTRDAYLKETRRKLDALRADLSAAEARTRLMVRMGWFELDRARRERSLYKNRLLELSQTSLDVSTRGYESGKVSFADVINSYNGWLDVNLAGQRRNSDVGLARAELERRVGTPLP